MENQTLVLIVSPLGTLRNYLHGIFLNVYLENDLPRERKYCFPFPNAVVVLGNFGTASHKCMHVLLLLNFTQRYSERS